MKSTVIHPSEQVDLFVKQILVFEEQEKTAHTMLPFFADGYPGLVFQLSQEGLWVQPQNKKMPIAFLYGQTLHPTELHLTGRFRLLVFQLYPFVLNSFFGVNPQELNDACYDLQQINIWSGCEKKLLEQGDVAKQIETICAFLFQVFVAQKQNLDFTIKQALQIILTERGQIAVKELCKKLHLTVRTFERRFLKEAGVSPKDFILITRFQRSLEQLSLKEFDKLSDIVYTNGYADQSHFIRVFKAFTGRTPSRFLKNLPR